jgi:hypothetical protein
VGRRQLQSRIGQDGFNKARTDPAGCPEYRYAHLKPS